ncbi:MAG: hypothetical protein FWE18_05485 [Alphaproteobacteria bacterium]|nr:hypothetical protein [Alphaproteobacteria bacterium]
MIRKKAKTIIFPIFLLIGAVLFLAVAANAFEYNNSTFLKISNLPNNKNARLGGYMSNKLNFTSLSFEANLLLDDDSYIYSLENRNALTYARGSGGASYTGETYFMSLGFFDSVASRNAYNQLFESQNQSFGVKALSRLNSEMQNYYTLMSAYIENNTALSALFLKSFFDESLYFGVSLTPSMQYSITPHRSISYQEDKSALDATVIYYNEYDGLGYGFNGSSRYYVNINNGTDSAMDAAAGLVLDYFGFSLKGRALWGDNNFELNTGETTEYKAFEASLYYSISQIVLGGYYLNSDIRTHNTRYQTEILELDVQYNLGENFALYSAVFYETLRLNNNSGLLLGFSASL